MKGNVLLAGSSDGTVWMFNIPNGNCMNVFTGHGQSVNYGTFTPDGKTLVTCSDDNTLITWDPRSGQAIHRFSTDIGRFHRMPINTFAIQKDGSIVATGSQDNNVILINISTGRILESLKAHTDAVESLDFCETMPLLASGSIDGLIIIWDVITMRVRHTFQHREAVTRVQFIKNSCILVSSSADNTIVVWDARGGTCIHSFKGHQDTVLDFRFAGNKIVSGGDDGVALVFPLDLSGY